MNDVTGNFGGLNGLTSDHTYNQGVSPISGVVTSGFYAGSYVSDWPPTVDTGPLPLTGPVEKTGSQLAALTNVNTPDMAPLTLIQDLYDLPRMLKDVKRLLEPDRTTMSAKDFANIHLMTKFGILPVIDDVKKLIDTQARVEKRMTRLRHLYDSGGERRTVRLGQTMANQGTKNVLVYSDLPTGTIRCDVDKTTTIESWQSIKWKLNSPPPQADRDFDRMYKLARDTANGITVAGMLQGAWDLLPWTWVIDWFTDIHSFVMAQQNQIGVTSSHACTMRHTKTTTTYTLASKTGSVSGNVGSAVRERKQRTSAGGIGFTSFVPAITLGQVSVLGSLFVQRFKG